MSSSLEQIIAMSTSGIDEILSESTIFGGTDSTEVPEILSESAALPITPDFNGLQYCKFQDNIEDNKLAGAMLKFVERKSKMGFTIKKLSESTGLTDTQLNALNDMNEKYAVLQEAAIGDAINKAIAFMRNAWQRMKTWFSNLFKSISVSMGDVEKSLKGVDAKLNSKNLSDFEYTGHDWKESDIPDKLGKNISAYGEEMKRTVAMAVNMSKETKAADDSRESYKNNDSKSNETEVSRKIVSKIISGSEGELTMDEAYDMIEKSYGFDTNGNKKGLSDWRNMITFLKGFKDNKTLKNAQKKCDEAYAKCISAAEKGLKEVNSLKNKVKPDANNAKNSTIFLSNMQGSIQRAITNAKSALNTYDQLMGKCISMEQAKFKEYRSVIASAVRYNPSSN